MRPVTTLAAWIALALALLAVYAPVRHHGYVEYDDPVYVRDNPEVAGGLGADGIAWAFTTAHAANYHPLTWLSHQLDVTCFGIDAPGSMHVVNGLLHLVVTLLVGLLAYRLGLGAAPAWLAAALFALHPLRVESVAWISERKDVLCAVFFLAALLAYVGHRRKPGPVAYGLVLACTALALLAKPMAVTLPAVMLAIDVWALGRGRASPGAPFRASTRDTPSRAPTPDTPSRAPTPDTPSPAPTPDTPSPAPTRPGKTSGARRGFTLVLEKWPLGVLVALGALSTWLAQSRGGSTSSLEGLALDLRALNALAAVKDYVTRTLWPVDLAVFYPHAAIVAEAPRRALLGPALVGLGLVLAATTWIVRGTRQPLARLGLAWFLVTLLPVIGLVQVGTQASADRYTYLPSVGLALTAAALLRHLSARAVLTIGAVLATPLAMASRRQVEHWRDTRTLFEHALAVTRRNYLAEGKLGELAMADGDVDTAHAAFERTLAIHPADLDALVNLALLERHLGHPDRARELLERARARSPHDANVRLNLGVLALDAGALDEAERLFRASLERQPDLADARFDLGLVAQGRGQPTRAEAEFRAAIALDPGHAEAWSNLGQVLLQQDRLPEATEAFARSVALDPADPIGHFNLSVVHERAGLVDAARADLERALALDPTFDLARQRLDALVGGR